MISHTDKITLAKIMLFYALLSFCVGPILGYEVMKNKKGITIGVAAGCIISIILWYKIGQNKIQLQ
jgi:hypothetical protein